MKHIYMAVLFSCLTAAAANAQTVSEDALRQCAAKSDSKERLECFDALARTPAAQQTALPPKRQLRIYRTRHEARASCPDDQIVWANTSSRTLYLPGNPHSWRFRLRIRGARQWVPRPDRAWLSTAGMRVPCFPSATMLPALL